MEEQLLYAMLETTFAEMNGIDDDDMELYNKELSKLLPSVWYTLSIETRISILDDAIKNNEPIVETDTYKNMRPEGTFTISK